jgi:hypothetical protein
VIVPRDAQVAYLADPDNKELITLVKTLNYRGKLVPPMIIFLGAYYLRRYFDNDMDGDTLFARSKSRYLNEKLGLKYLEHFNRYTKNSTKGRYRMLIFDGHGSYLSQNFLDYC